jgi:polyhydroxyalkanoate synthesis regulator phasin
MKHLGLFAVSLFWACSTGWALAQVSTPVSGNTPAVNAPAAMGKHPRFDEIHGRMKEQRERILEGVKTGKITKDEAKPLMEKVKAVGEQMKSDFQQNKQSGQKGLTDEQVQQLNQILDENSKAIYGEKHGGNDTPADPSVKPANP